MSIRETTILKGVAILFMLYLHLFNQMANVNLCTTYLSIRGVPFVHLFSRCTGPVAFYLILSGYGLYISSKSGRKQNSLKRILKLYVHYWITLILFIPLGCRVIGSQVYPGSFSKFLENVTGWNTSYNGEIWFLFPYVLLTISSPFLFHILNKMRLLSVFIVTGTLYLLAYVLIHLFGQSYLYSHQLAYMPVLYMSLLFPFMLGAMLVKYDIINKCKLWRCKSLFILLLLMVVRMYLETGVFHVLYSVAFIVLFVQIKRPVWLDTLLYEMGCRSTSMWFVHTYFCYYLFKDFIYGFKYPLLIFSVLLVVSYLFALVIDRIYQPLQQLITQKWR